MNMELSNLLLLFSALLYLISMVLYSLFLYNQKTHIQKTGFRIIFAAVVIHLLGLIAYTLVNRHAPIQDLSQSLSVSALAIGVMFLYFQYRFELKILGVFTSILLAAIMLTAVTIPQSPVPVNETLSGFWFYSHIILVFTGDASLALACGTGILYLLQEKGIKSKNPGFFFKRLPSLGLLDNVGYACLTTGFALLTIGLVTGFIYAKTIWGRFWSWDPKEVFSAGTWLVYAALLHLRLNAGWRGKKSAVMTIFGFIIIIFTFLGVNFLLGGHHQAFTR